MVPLSTKASRRWRKSKAPTTNCSFPTFLDLSKVFFIISNLNIHWVWKDTISLWFLQNLGNFCLAFYGSLYIAIYPPTTPQPSLPAPLSPLSYLNPSFFKFPFDCTDNCEICSSLNMTLENNLNWPCPVRRGNFFAPSFIQGVKNCHGKFNHPTYNFSWTQKLCAHSICGNKE